MLSTDFLSPDTVQRSSTESIHSSFHNSSPHSSSAHTTTDTNQWSRVAFQTNASQRYCPLRSLALANLSDLAYSSRRKIRSTLTKTWHFDHIEFFSLGHTEAFLAADESRIIVAFRGSDEPKDWIQNLDFDLVPGPLGGHVHRGFLRVARDVWREIQQTICRLRVQARWEGRELSLWFTGHSLGAALATLVVAQLRQAGEVIDGLYTYASPRVGDRTFAQAFNIDFGFKTFRVVNKNDLIPRIPFRTLHYQHVGQLFYFDHRNQLHSQSSAYFRFLDCMKVHANDLFDLDFSAAENHDIGSYLDALNEHCHSDQLTIAHYPPLLTSYDIGGLRS